MNRLKRRANRGGNGWLAGKYLAEAITGAFLLCGVLWMIIAVSLVRHDRDLIVEDSIYIVSTAVLLYLLLRRGIGALRSKELALRESEDRLARILETNASGIVVFDERGGISYANNAAAGILGEERSKLIGLRYDDPSWSVTDADGTPLPPERNPVVEARVRLLPVYDAELGILRRDGRRVLLTVNAAPLLDASGTVVGVVASFADVSERRKADATRVRKLIAAIEQSTSAVVITDQDGNVEYANPGYAAMKGCTIGGFISGETPHQCRVPPKVLEEMRAAIRSGEAWRGEFSCLRKDGQGYWEATSVTPIQDAEGRAGSLAWVREDVTERKQAEEALRRSEANYRAVVEDQTEFICRFRRDGTVTFVNEAFCRYFDKPRQELVGSPVQALPGFQQLELEGIARQWTSRDRNLPPIEYAIQVVNPSGETRWQRWTERAVFDEAGSFLEFQAVGSDVTEHRLADLALKESQEQFQSLVETISDWVWEIDRHGLYSYVSPKIRDLLGYQPGEVLGRKPGDFLPPGEAARLDETLRNLTKRRRPFAGLEHTYRHKDGREVIVETSGAPFFDAEGAFRGYRGVSRDIEERKRAEELLRASEERFRQLFEQNEEPLLLFRHGSHEILDANPAAVEMYGYERRELLEQGPALFVPEEGRETFRSAIAGIRPDAPLVIAMARHLCRDGRRIMVSIRAKSIRTSEGYVAYCSIRDITGRIRMEEEAKLQQAQLIHANRMASLGAIVSGVAHEVNNPNNLIMFNAPLILSVWKEAMPILDRHRGENGDFTLGGLPYSEMRDVMPKLAEGISDASQRIKGIVGNLKGFARQDEPGGNRAEPVNDIVRTAVMILNHEIMKKTYRFQAEFGEGLPPVMGSRQQLEQVVINLLHNALQALTSTYQAVRVGTSADPAAGVVEVHVTDEGIGMSRETLARITEPFFSTRLESGGLGLGLSISRSIVECHGGVLLFESAPGKGTRAVIRLPAVPPGAGEGADPSPTLRIGR